MNQLSLMLKSTETETEEESNDDVDDNTHRTSDECS